MVALSWSAGRLCCQLAGVIPYLTDDAITATMRELPPYVLTVAYVSSEESWEAAAGPLAAAFQSRVRELRSRGSRFSLETNSRQCGRKLASVSSKI
jgi:hypothetical protein